MATLSLFVLMVLHVMVVARGDPITARALLGVGSAVAIGLEVLRIFMPTLFILGASAYLVIAFPSPPKAVGAFLFATVLVLVSAPWPVAVGQTVLSGFVMGLLMLERPGNWLSRQAWASGYQKGVDELVEASGQIGELKDELRNAHELDPDERARVTAKAHAILDKYHEARERVTGRWLAVVLAALAFSLATFVLLPTPWLPHERIALEGGDEFVGYVVQEGDWTVLLRDADRSVHRVRASDVVRRELCRPGHAYLSAWSVLVGHEAPDYVDCAPGDDPATSGGNGET